MPHIHTYMNEKFAKQFHIVQAEEIHYCKGKYPMKPQIIHLMSYNEIGEL